MRVAVDVPGLDRGAQAGGLDLAEVDGEGGDAADEAAADVGAAADRGEPDVVLDLVVDPLEPVGGSGEPVVPMQRTAERSRSRPGWSSALRLAITYAAEVPRTVARVRAATDQRAPVSGWPGLPS
ncbi:hypothetical protein GCM10025734_20380 [Kitasatospora paranensis]